MSVAPREQHRADDNANLALLITGASLVLTGSVVSRILEFTSRTVIGRFLGPEEFGLFTTGMAALSVLGTVALFGIPSALVHFAGKYSKNDTQQFAQVLTTAFWFVAVVSTVAGALTYVFNEAIATIIFRNSEMAPVLAFTGLGLPLFALLSLVLALFQSQKDARSYSLLYNVTLPVIRIVAVILVAYLGLQLRHLLASYIVGALGLTLIIALVAATKHENASVLLPTVQPQVLQMLLRFSIPLLIGSLFGLSVWQFDVIFLQRFWGATETGYYSAAITVGRLPNVVLLAFSFILAPMVAQQYSNGDLRAMRKTYGHVVDFVFMIGLPIMVTFVIFAPLLLTVLFGESYATAGLPLQILSIGLFLHSIMGPNGNTLVMMGHSRLYLKDTFLGMLIGIILYLLLIPRFGSLGTALATVSTLMTINLLFSIRLFRFTKINPLSSIRYLLLLPAALAAAVGLITVSLLEPVPSPLLRLAASSIITITVYLGLTFILRVVDPGELITLARIVGTSSGHVGRDL